MIFLAVATLTTNLAANVVAPANVFSNLAPRAVSFRAGGLITAVIGVAMMPWKLAEDPTGYIYTWLIGYSALLGPIAGILIADYFVVRRTRLDLRALYERTGVKPAAIPVLVLAILPNVPGFAAQLGLSGVPEIWKTLYNFAWFIGFAIAFLLWLGYGAWRRTGTS
jgi:NCS1 family nucleobase:cation symporter-1